MVHHSTHVQMLCLAASLCLICGCGNKGKPAGEATPTGADKTTPDSPPVTDHKAEASDKASPEKPAGPSKLGATQVGAIVGSEAGLLWVGRGGESHVLVDGAVRWCRTDHGAKGTWALIGEEDTHLAFLPFAASQPGVLIEGLPPLDTVIVQQQAKPLSPSPEATAYDVALHVDVANGTAWAEIGCDGHMDTVCYEDPDADKRVLVADLKKKQAQIKKARVDGEGLKRHLAMSEGVQQGPRVKLPGETCEDCGRSTIVAPGLLSVLVAEEMGDFYHGFHLLYDQKKKTFFSPLHAQNHTADPGKLEGFEGHVWASEDLQLFATETGVFDVHGKSLKNNVYVCGMGTR